LLYVESRYIDLSDQSPTPGYEALMLITLAAIAVAALSFLALATLALRRAIVRIASRSGSQA